VSGQVRLEPCLLTGAGTTSGGDAATPEHRALAVESDHVPGEGIVRTSHVPGIVTFLRFPGIRTEVSVVAGGTSSPVFVVSRRGPADDLVRTPPGHVIGARVFGRGTRIVLFITQRNNRYRIDGRQQRTCLSLLAVRQVHCL